VVTTVLPAARAPLSAARDLFIDLDSATLVAAEPSGIDRVYPNGIDRPGSTFDGRFILTAGMRFPIGIPIVYPVSYRDLLTGATGALGSDVRAIVPHPSRQAVIVGFWNGDIGVLDAGGLRRGPLCDRSMSNPPNIAISGDGRELYANCSTSLRVLDTTTGAEVRRFDLAAMPRQIYPIASGRLFTLDYAGPFPFAIMEMSVYDAVTGARVANAPTPVPGSQLSWALPTPDGTRIIVGMGADGLYVLESATAQVIEVWPIGGVTHAAFTSAGDRAILLRETIAPPSFDVFLHGVLLDVASNTVLAEGPLGVRAYASSSHLIVLEPPQPPGDLAVEISGSMVTLRWSQPGASRRATDYVIEAGATPTSFTLLSQRTGSDETAFVVPNVPSGVYYVRVRAANAVGVSQPSGAIQVSVP
jgi:hypothetical protein